MKDMPFGEFMRLPRATHKPVNIRFNTYARILRQRTFQFPRFAQPVTPQLQKAIAKNQVIQNETFSVKRAQHFVGP